MKRRYIAICSFVFAMVMILTAFSGCGEPANTESVSDSETFSNTDNTDITENTENTDNTDITENTENTDNTENTGDVGETEKDTSPKLEGEYAELIENAYYTSNKVSAYFIDGDRSGYEITNMNMVYTYDLLSDGDILATLANKKGGVYIEKTMDVFVKMKTGKTYYSSQSTSNARGNSFRYGLYYYDVRLLDHNFLNNVTIVDSFDVDLSSCDTVQSDMKGKVDKAANSYKGKITGIRDPKVCWSYLDYDTSTFNALSFTVSAEQSASMEIFIVAGNRKNGAYSTDQRISIDIIPDGKPHTYVVPFDVEEIKEFEGKLTGLRFDFRGNIGESVEISNVKFIKRDYDNAPMLYLDRTLHTYSDKLHQTAHIVAGKDTEGIEEIGMITNIAQDTVAKLIVKDANGIHEILDDIDWSTAEYVGFDIKNVGIFGYIMPYDNQSGSMEVTLANGVYSIIQTKAPEGGIILAPVDDTSNDFYMGQRLYTDTNHDFEAFMKEAEIERHPLTADNIVVDTERSSETSVFNGYEALRGAYKFTLPGNAGFNDDYHDSFNAHRNVAFTVKGDTYDRNIYVLAYAFTGGLECTVVLDKNEMLLPISVQSCKNFFHEKEEPRFDRGDIRYAEAYFPMVVRAGESQTLKVIHLYQNWGANPLKQISSIQYSAPYYHLSTGVTETNCITNQYLVGKDLFTLPDHRAMSAPFRPGEPQHEAAGRHYFLQYTDSKGNYSASENIDNFIQSYGPTYAEIDMNYISDDGRIKVTYTHMEMPQTDENRTYYEMKYEVLEDISFDNFVEDFSFYKVSPYEGTYQWLGYLDESNLPQITEVNKLSTPKVYTLGDQCPYFDVFKNNIDSYANVSCLIYNYDLVIGGEKSDAHLAVVDHNYGSSLSIDLKEVTLKKGDTFTVNMIILPWGSQESVYDGSNGLAPDENVRRVRENTLLNPIVAIAVDHCEVLEDTYVPKVKTTDGNSATFKLSGGKENVLAGKYNTVVRAYGFDCLTVPKIMERVDGKWVEYRVNSAMTPDKFGNRHPYDGYGVHYDGDGTFSYSFVVDMSKGADREFMIVASNNFTGWTDEDRYPVIDGNGDSSTEDLVPDPLNLYFDAKDINDATISHGGKQSVLNEENETYFRLYGSGDGKKEAYITLKNVNGEAIGQYVVVKYRMPATNTEITESYLFDVFTSTSNTNAKGDDVAYFRMYETDGEWHVIVVDVTKFETNQAFEAQNGVYTANFIRFDCFNQPMSTESYIDIAYIGMTDDLAEVEALETELGEYILVEGSSLEKQTTVTINSAQDEYFTYKTYSNTTGMSGAVAELNIDSDGTKFIRYTRTPENTGKGITFHLTRYVSQVTGQYMLVKYRAPEGATSVRFLNSFGATIQSENETGKNNGDFLGVIYEGLVSDGEWHHIVIDLAALAEANDNTEFKANEDGTYSVKYIRTSVHIKEGDYFDIAFVGFADHQEALDEYASISAQ